MNLKFSILLAFIFAAFIKADDSQCTGCLCAASDNSTSFARGDAATLCAHFIAVNQTTGAIVSQRAAYPITVDTFSSVQLQGGQTTFQEYDFVQLVVQAHGLVKSIPLTYLQTSQFYSPAFSIVIQISGGIIQSVFWDHKCSTCDSSDCYKFSMSNGTLIDTICNNQTCISVTDPGCDPQIYVSWVGSDKNGAKMTSAGMRLSLFKQFSSTDLLASKTLPPYTYTATNAGNSTNTGNDTNTGNGTNTENGTETEHGTDSGNGTGTGNTPDSEPSGTPSTPITDEHSGNSTETNPHEGTTETPEASGNTATDSSGANSAPAGETESPSTGETASDPANHSDTQNGGDLTGITG